MYDVPGRPVISGYGFYTENIPAFLDYRLKPIAMQVKSFIKHTNNFLKTFRDLTDLLEESIIFTIDIGLRFLRNVLEK